MENEARLEDTVTDTTISGLLDKAILKVASPQAKYAVHVYVDRHDVSYLIFADGMTKFWKSRDGDGNPITDFEDVSKEDFMAWLRTQSQEKKKVVYENLSNYQGN